VNAFRYRKLLGSDGGMVKELLG